MEAKRLSIKQAAILFFVSGLLLLSGLDKIDVNIMEARNFISAREMVENKEYLLTTLNNQPRYEKPPLPTWLTAIAGATFGFDSLFAMRLPVVFATLLLVFCFYYFSLIMGLGAKHALFNALVLITSFYIFFAGRDNQWDMYTHSFMMVGIFFLWKLFHDDSNQWRNSLLSGLFLGFSMLSKGPVSVYALFLPFLISYGIVFRIPFRRKWKYIMAVFMSGLVLGASWYVYVRLKDPESFTAIASRETSNWGSYEVKPFYYYWNFFLQTGLWAIPSLIALFYPYLKSRVSNLKAYRFAVLWTLLSIILLSAIPEKKVRYLVPALIPLALTTGFYIEYLIRSFKSNTAKWENNLVYFFSGLIALVGFAYPFALIFVLKGKLMSHLLIAVFSSVLMYGCTFFVVRGMTTRSFSAIFYAMVALFVSVVIALVPLSKEVVYNPDYASAKKARHFEKEYGVKSYSLSAVAPEIIWNFGKSIPILEQKGAQVCLPNENQFALLVDRKDSASLRSQFPQFEISILCRINLYYKKSMKDRLVKDYYLFRRLP